MWIFGYGSLVFKADFPYIKKVVGYVKGYERKFWQASIDHRGVPEKPGRVVTLVPSEDPEHRVYGIAYKIHRKDVDLVIKQLDLREAMGYEKVPATFHPVTHHPLNIFDHSITPTRTSTNNAKDAETNRNSSSIPVESSTIRLPKNSFGSESDDSGHGESLRGNSLSNDDGVDSDTDSGSLTSSDSEDDDWDPHYDNVRRGQPFRVSMYFGSDTNEHFMGPSSLSEMALQIFQCTGKSGRNRDYLFFLADSMREISEEAVDQHLSELEAAVRLLEIKYGNDVIGTENVTNVPTTTLSIDAENNATTVLRAS